MECWDAARTGDIPGHGNVVSSVAFSPNGKTLATGSRDSVVKLSDVATREELKTLIGHEKSVWCMAFTPDGKILATGSLDNTVKLWDVAMRRN